MTNSKAFLLIALILCAFSQTAKSQTKESKPTITMLKALEMVIESKDTLVDLTGYMVEGDWVRQGTSLNLNQRDTYLKLRDKYKDSNLVEMVDSIIVIRKDVRINATNATFYNLSFDELIVNMEFDVDFAYPKEEQVDNFEIVNCGVNKLTAGGGWINLTNVSVAGELSISSLDLTCNKVFNSNSRFQVDSKKVVIANSSIVDLWVNATSSLDLYENLFNGAPVIYGEMESLRVFNNSINGDLSLSNLTVKQSLYLQNNIIEGKIVFGEFVMPENSVIHWDFAPGQMAYAIPVYSDSTVQHALYGGEQYESYVSASNPAVVETSLLFLGLNALHKKFYDYFISRGDIESANRCYIEMKDLQTMYYAHLYELHGGYQNYIRWRLNWIMKSYTAYGTDPSLALVVSSYVILIFAVIFLFFPSEWDTTSHPALRDHYKSLAVKEKILVRKIANLLYALLIAVFNAITLSLNSFITIGFGNIPTQGVARYACILEGTLGWFLLTLFSVALISQLVY